MCSELRLDILRSRPFACDERSGRSVKLVAFTTSRIISGAFRGIWVEHAGGCTLCTVICRFSCCTLTWTLISKYYSRGPAGEVPHNVGSKHLRSYIQPHRRSSGHCQDVSVCLKAAEGLSYMLKSSRLLEKNASH